MSDSERVILERDGAVAVVTMNRPDAMNALDVDMAKGLLEKLRLCAADRGVRAVILTGAGKAFMAGGDIKWFHSGLSQPDDVRAATISQTIGTIHDAIETIATMDQPVIARVQGAAAGFGLSLMAACDLVMCADDAVLSLAYIKIGTSPDGGSTFSLPRAIGTKKAMELALLGDRFGAQDALSMGLINQTVPAGELEERTAAVARSIAAGPREATARTKRLVRGSLDNDLRAQLDAEQAAFVEGFVGPEFAEGITAFVEKRAPRYPD